jgi:hypothetical protein
MEKKSTGARSAAKHEGEYQIRCKLFPGQFSGEYAVEGVQANGERFSLFVPEKFVEPDEPPTRDRTVDGWLKVPSGGRQGTASLSDSRESPSRAATS